MAAAKITAKKSSFEGDAEQIMSHQANISNNSPPYWIYFFLFGHSDEQNTLENRLWSQDTADSKQVPPTQALSCLGFRHMLIYLMLQASWKENIFLGGGVGFYDTNMRYGVA